MPATRGVSTHSKNADQHPGLAVKKNTRRSSKEVAAERQFVSTYMQYVGSLPNPWDIPAKLACGKMQLIWDAVFPNIKYEVTSTSAVYFLVRPPYIYLHYY
jgi:hypothetical protein